jgi:hypothetical protein
LAGIIYLHDISRSRMFGSHRQSFAMFTRLCGDDATRNVVLVTTQWSGTLLGQRHEPELSEDWKETLQQEQQHRERELSERYWKEMLQQGSKLMRFENTHESAWAIIHSVVEELPLEVIQIQQELVDFQKLLPETGDAKVLRGALEELLEEQRVRARDLERVRTQELQESYNETVQQIHLTVSDAQKMKIPLGRRIRKFFAPTG